MLSPLTIGNITAMQITEECRRRGVPSAAPSIIASGVSVVGARMVLANLIGRHGGYAELAERHIQATLRRTR